MHVYFANDRNFAFLNYFTAIDNMLMNGILPEIAYTDLDFYECLSAGTFGTVYRAKYLPQNQIVAVKRVLVLEKEVWKMFLRRRIVKV